MQVVEIGLPQTAMFSQPPVRALASADFWSVVISRDEAGIIGVFKCVGVIRAGGARGSC